MSTISLCNVFENISSMVWNKIVKDHNVKINTEEESVTKDIIVEFRTLAETNTNIGIWANKVSKKAEAIVGSDINIIIEYQKENFVWFALQAKILNFNQKYAQLSYSDNQSQKLEKLKLITKCTVGFLFYSGVSNSMNQMTDRCGNTFLESQFGCSIVSLQSLRQFKLDKINFSRPAGDYLSLRQYMIPFRNIVCCPPEIPIQYFSGMEIKKFLGSFEKIDTNALFPHYEYEDYSNFKGSDDFRELLVSTKKVEWTSDFTIVIRLQ